jgi:hypothetical protein
MVEVIQIVWGIGAIAALGTWTLIVAARRNRRAATKKSKASLEDRAPASVASVSPARTLATRPSAAAVRPTTAVGASAGSSSPSAGGVVARGDEPVKQPSAGGVVARGDEPVRQPSAGGVAARGDEPVRQPSAGGVVARGDEPVSSFEIAANVSAVRDVQPDSGELAAQAAARSLSTERRVRPLASRFPSTCPGWLGAVLNYGSLVQAFFADYLEKHNHMSFDFDTVHTDNYSSIVYDEPTEFEIRTAPDSVPKLWFHTWREPPPPCVGLVSDRFVNWRRDLRGPVASRAWEGDRGIWFDWDCWGLWKVWPVIVCLNHPQADFGLMLKAWGRHDRLIEWADKFGSSPAGILAAMAGDEEIADRYPYWRKVERMPGLSRETAYYPTLPPAGKRELTANRELAAIPTDTVANSSWPNPDIVRQLNDFQIALFVANWNERLMDSNRWKKRFILRDIRPLMRDNTLPHTWRTTAASGDWEEQIRQLNNAYNYLMNGRWVVWATMMYALAFHQGDSGELPGWFVNHCSAWGVPVPRPGRNAKSVSVEGGLAIDKKLVPKHFGTELGQLLRACQKSCPMPGSVPVSAMQEGKLLSWNFQATGHYRPPARWLRGWWAYRISKEKIGTNWADVIQGAVLSIAASAASDALDTLVDVGIEAIDAALDELPAIVEEIAGGTVRNVFREFAKKISAYLIPFAGNLTKGFCEDWDLSSDLMKRLECISQYGTEKFERVAEGLFAGSLLAGDTKAIYNDLRDGLDADLANANKQWGYIADLFGEENLVDSMMHSNDSVGLLYQSAQRYGKKLY